MKKSKWIIIILIFLLVIAIGTDIYLVLSNNSKKISNPNNDISEPNDQTLEFDTSCTKKVQFKEGMTKGEFLPFPVEEETITYNIHYNQNNELLYYYYNTYNKCVVKEQYDTILNTQYSNIVDIKSNEENLEIYQTFAKQYPDDIDDYQYLIEKLENKGYACE